MISTFILPFSFNDFPVYSHEILSLRQRQVWLPPLSGLRPMAQVAWRAATQAASAPVFLRSTVCSLALNMKKSWSHENNKAFRDLGGWLCHTLKVSSVYCKRATDAIYYYISYYHILPMRSVSLHFGWVTLCQPPETRDFVAGCAVCPCPQGAHTAGAGVAVEWSLPCSTWEPAHRMVQMCQK